MLQSIFKEFIEAVRNKHLRTVKAGIDAGFKADLKDNIGDPLLMIAVFDGHYKMCELLLKNGARPNAIGLLRKTALMWAAFVNNLKMCQLLLSYGADVRQTSEIGETALLCATKSKGYELIKLLLSKGSNVNKKDQNGDSVLHLVIPCSNQLVKLIIDHGADINAVNNDGYTPLMHACLKVNLGNALILAQAGAKFQVGHRSAWTCANQQVIRYLARNGFHVGSF